MRLRREVDDDVRLLLLKDAVDRTAVRDVRANELEVLLLHHRLKRLEIARIRQLVDADDAVARMLLEHVVNEVRANEAGTAGHDNRHKNSLLKLIETIENLDKFIHQVRIRRAVCHLSHAMASTIVKATMMTTLIKPSASLIWFPITRLSTMGSQ